MKRAEWGDGGGNGGKSWRERENGRRKELYVETVGEMEKTVNGKRERLASGLNLGMGKGG